ncbi:MAG: type IV pilus assembly protein PilE [Gallionellaceae bacterium]|nr:MAG: type IV pilus assembly protein PilE [Gallionellaceae bacterium]
MKTITCCTGNRASSKTPNGFTLIELMIVVAIVGILALVAVPSYRQHVVKSNRAAAEGFILGVANKQEQYMLDARTYAGVAADPGDTTGLVNRPNETPPGLGMTVPADVVRNYNILIGAVSTTPPGYKITAVPIGSQLADDTQCGAVSIDQAGTKLPTTPGCW